MLKQWFGRHPHRHKASAPGVNWTGRSGRAYAYKVYPITTPFRPLPGNFIYAMQDAEGQWIPIYIAQSRDLHQRLEGHVSVDGAIQHGATHVHAHYDVAGQAARCAEERDLVERWHPSCNDY